MKYVKKACDDFWGQSRIPKVIPGNC